MGSADNAKMMIYRAQQEMAKASNECLVQGACVNCSKGTTDCIVELPKNHGRYIGNQAQLTAQDTTRDNISGFGWCNALDQPCRANLTPWIDTNENDLIFNIQTASNEAVPTTASIAVCYNDGITGVTSSGQPYIVVDRGRIREAVEIEEKKIRAFSSETYGHIKVKEPGVYSITLLADGDDFKNTELQLHNGFYVNESPESYLLSRKYEDEEYVPYNDPIPYGYIGGDGTIIPSSELKYQWKAVLSLMHNQDYHIYSLKDTTKTYKVLLEPNLDCYIFRHGLSRKFDPITNVVPTNSRYGAIWCIDDDFKYSYIWGLRQYWLPNLSSTKGVTKHLHVHYILYMDQIMGGVFYQIVTAFNVQKKSKKKKIIETIKERLTVRDFYEDSAKFLFDQVMDKGIDVAGKLAGRVNIFLGILGLFFKEDNVEFLDQVATAMKDEAKVDLTSSIKHTKYPLILKIGDMTEQVGVDSYNTKKGVICEKWEIPSEGKMRVYGEKYSVGRFKEFYLKDHMLNEISEVLSDKK